ncbi:hypothetical protein [Peribacillus asahii]|uniref:hypothetical protein n=1 Tax=Peribacillus asahii TaxID=228899 RepID=UPI00207A75BA|nr:hypothetical protein [Peribacillus asahii]USK68699.1 hypothetical protein LIS76_14010 [Peribacillus asahii]
MVHDYSTTAIVTGATGGIGRAMIKRLVIRGLKLVPCGLGRRSASRDCVRDPIMNQIDRILSNNYLS